MLCSIHEHGVLNRHLSDHGGEGGHTKSHGRWSRGGNLRDVGESSCHSLHPEQTLRVLLEVVDSPLLLQVGGDTLLQEGNLHSLCRNGVVDDDVPCCHVEMLHALLQRGSGGTGGPAPKLG